MFIVVGNKHVAWIFSLAVPDHLSCAALCRIVNCIYYYYYIHLTAFFPGHPG